MHASPNGYSASGASERTLTNSGNHAKVAASLKAWAGQAQRAGDLHPQLSRQLTETAPVIRSALERLHGRPALIVTPEDVPVTNGRLVLSDSGDTAVLPSLAVEFTLRGLVFSMEVPLGRVFEIVGSWTGMHFVCRLPSDHLRIERPVR